MKIKLIFCLIVAASILHGQPSFDILDASNEYPTFRVFASNGDGSILVGSVGDVVEAGRAHYLEGEKPFQLIPLPDGSDPQLDDSLQSAAFSITPDGRFIGGQTWDDEGYYVAFIYEPELDELITLPSLGGRDSNYNLKSRLQKLSNDGLSATGYAVDEDGMWWPYLWTKENGMEAVDLNFSVLEGTQIRSGWASGISGDGSRLVGSYNIAEADQRPSDGLAQMNGWIWDSENGSRILNPLLEGGIVEASSISGDGQLVVGFSEMQNGPMRTTVATAWDYETQEPTYLGLPEEANVSFAWSTNFDGTVIAGAVVRTVFNGDPDLEVIYDATLWLDGYGSVNLETFLNSKYGIDTGSYRLLEAYINSAGTIIHGVAEHEENKTKRSYILKFSDPVNASGFYFLSPPEGAIDFYPRGISGNGKTIVGTSTFDPDSVLPVIWTQSNGTDHVPFSTGLVPGNAKNPDSTANDITPDGRYVVGYTWDEDGNSVGYRYDRKIDKLLKIDDFDVDSNEDIISYLMEISDDGSVAVGAASFGVNTHSFKWEDGGGIQRLEVKHLFNDTLTEELYRDTATSISADGQVIGGYVILYEEGTKNAISGVPYYYRESEGIVRRLVTPITSNHSLVYGISANGEKLLGYINLPNGSGYSDYPAYWESEEGSHRVLALPNGWINGWAYSSNSDASIITGDMMRKADNEDTSEYSAFIWTQETGIVELEYALKNQYDLDSSGYSLLSANISDNGAFLYGIAKNKQTGEDSTYLVVLPKSESPDYSFMPGSFDIGEGWRWSEWFGNYYTASFPWVYSQDHGWIYSLQSNGEDTWYYDPLLGIFYTNPHFYPYLFNYPAGGGTPSQLLYLEGTRGVRWFFNFNESVNDWFSVGQTSG